MKLITGAFFALLVLPVTSQAYFTTAQSAVKITDDTALFTITYKFGVSGRALYMPIGALRADDNEPVSPYLEYKVLNDDETAFTAGTDGSLVFTNSSNIEIRNNQYYVPVGQTAEFTLVSLITIPERDQNDDLNLLLLVTSLPFTMIKDEAVIPAQLNPSELQYYRTPEIKF